MVVDLDVIVNCRSGQEESIRWELVCIDGFICDPFFEFLVIFGGDVVLWCFWICVFVFEGNDIVCCWVVVFVSVIFVFGDCS